MATASVTQSTTQIECQSVLQSLSKLVALPYIDQDNAATLRRSCCQAVYLLLPMSIEPTQRAALVRYGGVHAASRIFYAEVCDAVCTYGVAGFVHVNN